MLFLINILTQQINSNMYLYARWLWVQFPWLSLQHASTCYLDKDRDRDRDISINLNSQRDRDGIFRDLDQREGILNITDRGSSRLAHTARMRLASQTGRIVRTCLHVYMVCLYGQYFRKLLLYVITVR